MVFFLSCAATMAGFALAEEELDGLLQLRTSSPTEENNQPWHYKHMPQACVNGANIRLFKDHSVDDCKFKCDFDPSCVGFEYGVAHGGSGTKWKPGDCQLQSSVNTHGCNGKSANLDFYARVLDGDWYYEHEPAACVNGANIKLYPDQSVDECKAKCDAEPACKGFEYGAWHGGSGTKWKLRDCQLQSSADTHGCPGSSANLDFYARVRKNGDKLLTDATLISGGELSSATGIARLVMQTDGNLVIYHDGRPMWATHTGERGAFLKLQSDGNLVMYHGSKAVWQSDTVRSGAVQLQLQDNCELVMSDAAGEMIWSVGTCCGCTELMKLTPIESGHAPDSPRWAWDQAGSGACQNGAAYHMPTTSPAYKIGYRPLGDLFTGGGPTPIAGDIPLFKGNVVHPFDFELVWNDKGSGGYHDLSVWKPRALPGYTCPAHTVTSGSKPHFTDVVCLPNECLEPVELHSKTWTDACTGAAKDFDAFRSPIHDSYFIGQGWRSDKATGNYKLSSHCGLSVTEVHVCAIERASAVTGELDFSEASGEGFEETKSHSSFSRQSMSLQVRAKVSKIPFVSVSVKAKTEFEKMVSSASSQTKSGYKDTTIRFKCPAPCYIYQVQITAYLSDESSLTQRSVLKQLSEPLGNVC